MLETDQSVWKRRRPGGAFASLGLAPAPSSNRRFHFHFFGVTNVAVGKVPRASVCFRKANDKSDATVWLACRNSWALMLPAAPVAGFDAKTGAADSLNPRIIPALIELALVAVLAVEG